MKTAMQEAIKEIAELWGSPSDRPTYSQIFKVLEDKLEKEKEQMIDFAYKCIEYKWLLPQDIFNAINQNK
jgi:hypothetical protein